MADPTPRNRHESAVFSSLDVTDGRRQLATSAAGRAADLDPAEIETTQIQDGLLSVIHRLVE